MYAIISELDKKSAKAVSKLWYELCNVCGLRAIYNIPTPHFTWFTAADLDIAEVELILSQLAKTTDRLTTHTFGFGVFSGEKPVLYLPMVKSAAMISLNQKIWDQISPISDLPNQYYSPEFWLPHVTLALDDLNRENLVCAVNILAFRSLELFILVDNLVIAENDDDPPGKTLHKFQLIE